MFSCKPEDWLGSNEVITDELRIINEIKERLLSISSSFTPSLTEYETNHLIIKYFLKLKYYNKENTYNEIIEWLTWRRGYLFYNSYYYYFFIFFLYLLSYF